MKIHIGVQHDPRQIDLEVDDAQKDSLMRAVRDAITSGTPLVVEDVKGRTVMVPGEKISHVEFAATEQRRVGFLG
ncbi:DUF3107 domain-containing protein [Dermabacteraceae bacterium P7006]